MNKSSNPVRDLLIGKTLIGFDTRAEVVRAARTKAGESVRTSGTKAGEGIRKERPTPSA
jgi:hydrogenase maturation factor